MREERQVGLALAAQELEVDLDAADAARLRQRDRLRREPLRREDATAGLLGRVDADEPEVARQLLDRVDRPRPLDLDGDPAASRVAAHQIDGADVGRPFAPHEGQLLAQRRRRRRQLLLQVPLHPVLLQRGRLAHVVHDVAQHLDEPDLEHVVRLQLANDEPVALVLDEGRRRHPVERLVAAGVVVDEHGAVRLQDQQPHRLRQHGVETARVADLAAGDEQAHAGNLLSLPDMARGLTPGLGSSSRRPCRRTH